MITNRPKIYPISSLFSDRENEVFPFPSGNPSDFSDGLSENPNQSCTVLIVDDEPLFLDLTRRHLEKTGYIKCICCSSAQEACSKKQEEDIDIIISDYDMPGMNGIQYLTWVRESGSQIPFILCTGRGREEIVIEALNCGASYYIGKGCDPKSMYAELCNVIRHITNTLHSERTIREKEHLISSVFKHLPDPTYAVDINGKVIAWNRAMEELTGISHKQAEGSEKYRNLIPYHPEISCLPVDIILGKKDELSDLFEFLLQTSDMIMNEISFAHEDHSFTTYWIKTTSLCSESGHLLGAIETIRDVTIEKKNETDLKEKSRYHRNLVEIHIDPLITIGEDLTISDLNRAAEEIIGNQRENMIGTPFPQLFHESEYVEKICKNILYNSLQVRDIPLNLLTNRGIKPVFLIAVPCNGELLSTVRIFIELHENPVQVPESLYQFPGLTVE